MSPKKVTIGLKPGTQEKPASLDDWVTHRTKVEAPTEEAPTEASLKMKRLTLDIPESLHRAIKRKAVEEGVTMAEQLRALLLKHYGNEESPE
jgi:predicted DNA binding CopG/RHH family protein